MSIFCYIVDDEFHAIEVLKDYIKKTPGLEVAGFSTKPLEALEEITANRPAITLLDIDMPEINGLEFAGLVNAFTTIIFTTAYREYAPEAFEKEAADYLLKPIPYERFLRCIQRVRRNIADHAKTSSAAGASFFVKTGIKGKLTKISAEDIYYVGAALNYVEIYLKDKKIITYLTLQEVMGKLPGEGFSRIHKSFIINHYFIQSIEYGQVRLQDQTIIPVGRAYRAAFREKIAGSFLFSKRDYAG